MKRDEMIERLRPYCEMKRTVTLVFGNQVLWARFDHVSRPGVAFEVLSLERQILFRPLMLCVVMIHRPRSRNLCFVSPALEFERQHTAVPKLLVLLPSELVATESRSVLRVPVSRFQSLPIRILGPDRNWKASCVDLSSAGAMLEFSGRERPPLQIDASIPIDLQLEEDTETVLSQVRHVNGKRCGLRFQSFVKEGPMWVPHALRKTLSRIEEAWVKQGLV